MLTKYEVQRVAERVTELVVALRKNDNFTKQEAIEIASRVIAASIGKPDDA